jgi:hypothetical protein
LQPIAEEVERRAYEETESLPSDIDLSPAIGDRDRAVESGQECQRGDYRGTRCIGANRNPGLTPGARDGQDNRSGIQTGGQRGKEGEKSGHRRPLRETARATSRS